jgi:hypothetical protein
VAPSVVNVTICTEAEGVNKRAESVEPRRMEVTSNMSDRTTVNKLEDSGEVDATEGDRRGSHSRDVGQNSGCSSAAWPLLPVAKISRSLVERGLMEC